MTKDTQNIEINESQRDEYQKWICGFVNANNGLITIDTMEMFCGIFKEVFTVYSTKL